MCTFLEGKQGVGSLHPHSVGFALQSKGGILSKACDYIQELRQSNHRLSEELQGLDQLQLDNDVLRQQVRRMPGRPPWQPVATDPVCIPRKALPTVLLSRGCGTEFMA